MAWFLRDEFRPKTYGIGWTVTPGGFVFNPHLATVYTVLAWLPASKTEVIQNGKAEFAGVTSFALNERAPTGAGMREITDGLDSMQIDLCMLDETIKVFPGQARILLMANVGATWTPRGGMSLITRQRPLTILNVTPHRAAPLNWP